MLTEWFFDIAKSSCTGHHLPGGEQQSKGSAQAIKKFFACPDLSSILKAQMPPCFDFFFSASQPTFCFLSHGNELTVSGSDSPGK